MKLSDFETLTYKELESMDIQTLKKLASEQAGKLNKRLDRINSSSKTNKSAVRAVQQSGGRFGVKGLTVKNSKGEVNISVTKRNLISEIKREQNFQKAKTGTFRGAKEVQEKSGSEIMHETKKQYSDRKAKEYREKKKEEIGERKWKKMAKKEKAKIYRDSRKEAKKAEKEYDKKIGNYWDIYHKYKEKHPATLPDGQFSQYYAEGVKQLSTRVAGSTIAQTKAEVEAEIEKISKKAFIQNSDIENAKTQAVWQTVDKDNPFDVKEDPTQLKLINGRIV